jgi:protein-arginine kinase activator protein McsA
MDEAGVIISEESSIEEKPGVEEEIDEDQDLTPLEALQKQLKAAIEEERYEDAARLKDEIDKLAKSN